MVRQVLEFLGWTIIALVVAMVFDVIVKGSLESSYIAPKGAPWPEVRGFSGFTSRHAVLGVTAVWMQEVIRHRPSNPWPSFVLLGLSMTVYVALLLRDLYRRLIKRPRSDDE